MRGANILIVALAWLGLAATSSCAAHTRADNTSFPFRASGVESYQGDNVVVWSETGSIAVRDQAGGWRASCKLPLQSVNQVLVADAELYIVGFVDESTRAALLTTVDCKILARWRLPDVWADLVLDGGRPLVVTAESTSRLRPDGETEPSAGYVRTGSKHRPRMDTVHWLSFDDKHVLCRDRVLNFHGRSPGWCAQQQPDGWITSGEYTAAISCGGIVLVRESFDAKRVRWTSLSAETGRKLAEIKIPRGVIRCIDGHIFASADTALRLLDARTLRVLSVFAASETPIAAFAALPNEIVIVDGHGGVRTLPRQ